MHLNFKFSKEKKKRELNINCKKQFKISDKPSVLKQDKFKKNKDINSSIISQLFLKFLLDFLKNFMIFGCAANHAL